MSGKATSGATRGSDELYASIKAWLSKEGYPLELKVAHAFGRSNWEYALGQRFADPTTGALREVDIVASRRIAQATRNWAISATMTLVVECKSSGDRKPWVVFGADPDDDANVSIDMPLDFDLIPAGRMARKALNQFFKLSAHRAAEGGDDADSRGLRTLSIAARNPGSAVVEAFRKASDNAYAAVMAATSAASALADNRSAHETTGKGISIQFFVPVTVVEASVFRFWVTLDGHEHLEDVGITSVVLDHAGNRERTRHPQPTLGAHVVSFDYLGSFITRVTQDAEQILNVLVGSARAARRLHVQLRTGDEVGES